MHSIKIGAALTALLLSACAATPQPDWRHGGKKATIVQAYSAATPRAELPECLAALPPQEMARRHFVRLSYHHVRRMHYAVAEMPDSLPKAVVGDEVELWPLDCAVGQLSRIGPLLTPPSP